MKSIIHIFFTLANVLREERRLFFASSAWGIIALYSRRVHAATILQER